MSINHSKWHQFLFDHSLGIRKSGIPKFKSFAFRLYNSIIKKERIKGQHSKFIKFKYGNGFLWVNSTHQLPFTLTYSKLYSTNLPRICKYVSSEIPDLKVVDIGANIGDTVFLIKQSIDCPILCVEGNPDYIPLLKHNIEFYNDVELEESFVGSVTGLIEGSIVSDGRGTSYVEKGLSQNKTFHSFKSLEDILGSHKAFMDMKILKIDTDGYDCDIIRSNIDLIARVKPLIFFEYAPAWMPQGKDSEIRIFEVLKKSGYSMFLFYGSEGELIFFSKDINDDIRQSAHQYLSRGNRAGDIVAIHKQDEDLYEIIKASELQFMRSFFE